MKRINVYKNDIYEIAKIIKEKISDKKIYLFKNGKRITIKVPKDVDRFLIEEIRSSLKFKFPDHEVIFQYAL